MKITSSERQLNSRLRHGAAAVLALLIVGCNSRETPSAPPQIAKEQRNALEQAKQIEGVINQQAEGTRRQLDEENTR